MSKFYTRKQVSLRYPVSYSTLAHMAMSKSGPPFGIVAGKAMYREVDIEYWFAQHFSKGDRPKRKNDDDPSKGCKVGRPRKKPPSPAGGGRS